MEKIADFISQKEQIESLQLELDAKIAEIDDSKKENDRLKAKNLQLAAKNKIFNDECRRTAISRDKLKGKHKRTVLIVAELYVQGFISLSISQIADKLFTSFDNMNCAVTAVKRGKSEKLQVNR
tara:strand:- start:11134 stop:11505 length:372 start_codon:yes stop_codon:yes gene_type:complete